MHKFSVNTRSFNQFNGYLVTAAGFIEKFHIVYSSGGIQPLLFDTIHMNRQTNETLI